MYLSKYIKRSLSTEPEPQLQGKTRKTDITEIFKCEPEYTKTSQTPYITTSEIRSSDMIETDMETDIVADNFISSVANLQNTQMNNSEEEDFRMQIEQEEKYGNWNKMKFLSPQGFSAWLFYSTSEKKNQFLRFLF